MSVTSLVSAAEHDIYPYIIRLSAVTLKASSHLLDCVLI